MKTWPALPTLAGLLVAMLGLTFTSTTVATGQPQVPQDVAQRLAPDCPARHQ